MSRNQNDMVLEALRQRSMTAAEIWQELGIARASARVYDLRNDGWDIRSREITVRNRRGEPCRVALYSLAEARPGMPERQLVPVVHPGRGVMAA